MDPFDGDPVFSALVHAAFDQGRAALRALASGPMAPFVLTPDAEPVRFAGTDYDEDQLAALAFARAGAFAAWAVAWDGYLKMGGEQTDALLVRAFRAGGRQELLFAWRYTREGGVEMTGNPAFLGAAR